MVKLFGHPIGTKVRLDGKIGTMTNVAPFEVWKTFEVTFDDGSTKLYKEQVNLGAQKLAVMATDKVKELVEELKVKTRRVKELSEECGAIASEAAKNEAALNRKLGASNEKYKQVDALYYNCCKKLEKEEQRANEAEAVLAGYKVVEVPPTEGVWPKPTKEAYAPIRLGGKGDLKNLKPKDHVLFTAPMKEGLTEQQTVVDVTPDLGAPVSAPVKLATKVIEMLNEENVKKILKESGGTALVSEIASKTESSAHAVYRFLRKLVIGNFGETDIRVGKLPEPDHKEGDVNVWLASEEAEMAATEEEPTEAEPVESEQESSVGEVEEVSDAEGGSDDPVASEQSAIPTEVFGAGEGPQAEEE